MGEEAKLNVRVIVTIRGSNMQIIFINFVFFLNISVFSQLSLAHRFTVLIVECKFAIWLSCYLVS